ncbi:MAG: MarR family transcriptional regulator [Betaproteobacteria bacterium]
MKTDNGRTPLDDAHDLGHEGRAARSDHAALRLWLRMLACTTQIEDEVRRRLRARFDISLPRFDYLAQLYRQPDGMKMKELSRYLMVTGGNVTGVTEELVRDGLVSRENSTRDRRAWIVSLTAKGRDAFAGMASEHERWILELFAGLDKATVQQLHGQLGNLRLQVTRRQEEKHKEQR